METSGHRLASQTNKAAATGGGLGDIPDRAGAGLGLTWVYNNCYSGHLTPSGMILSLLILTTLFPAIGSVDQPWSRTGHCCVPHKF